ncbi:MAG: hypothetical protein P4L61_02765 [Candidatus Pacebacteria bacterium]|nr:hypothetical protein [Candidatus Paceibacterota bacterium]
MKTDKLTSKEKVPMGTVIDSANDRNIEVITASTAHGHVPGLGWKLSEDTEKALDEIDAHLRSAENIVGRMFIG